MILIPKQSNDCDYEEPYPGFFKLMAYQMRSHNFGSGGRIPERPTEDELKKVNKCEIEQAKIYFLTKLKNKTTDAQNH